MKEYKKILTISKGFIEKKHHKKINSLNGNEEKINLLRYLIISKIKPFHSNLSLLAGMVLS